MHRSVLELVRANRGRTIAAVSHGCAIRNFLCWAQGMPLERIGEVPWLHNTSLSCVEFDSEDRPKLLLIDDYSHLPEGCVLFSRREMAKMAGNPQK
jgi:probable phosphoglycerate mutase